MAEYFTGKRDVTRFVVEHANGKARLECTVSEYWKLLLTDTVKCGAQVTHDLKRSSGIKAIEKTTLENSLQASIGLKDLAEIKAVAKDHVSTEICWETLVEEERSVTFVAPKCGRYTALQYQKLRDYYFLFQDSRWFHKGSWQSYFTEHTNYYHDDSKSIDLDPDCNCRMPDPGDIDGVLHLDFGKTSMHVAFRRKEHQIEADFSGKKVVVELPGNAPFILTVPPAYISASLRFLGQMTEENYTAEASLYVEPEIQLARPLLRVRVEELELT